MFVYRKGKVVILLIKDNQWIKSKFVTTVLFEGVTVVQLK